MDDVIQYVRPVILLDAAHMKSKWKGTPYIASTLTALDNVYILAFAISNQNKNLENWNWFLDNLQTACPTLKINHPNPRFKHNKYSFVLDCDKGLERAVGNVFPNSHSYNCAFHIKQNVQTKFGQSIAEKVIEIAKTFSTVKEEHLLLAIEQTHPAAARYLRAINPEKWRSSRWNLPNNTLPP